MSSAAALIALVLIATDAGSPAIVQRTGVNPNEATRLFGKSCKGGSPVACLNLGVLLADEDPKQAVELFARSCDAKIEEGCLNAGNHYNTGRGVPLDKARATDFYRRGCEGGSGKACFNQGWALEFDPVTRDVPKALKIYERGCKLGAAKACFNLAVVLERGRGAPRNEGRAREFYGHGCEAGSAESCFNLGSSLFSGGAPAEKVRGVGLWERACLGGDVLGCQNATRAASEGVTGAPDPVRALRFRVLGCRLGDDDSCHATRGIEEACAKGDGAACEVLKTPSDAGR